MRIIQSDAETGEVLGNAVIGVIYGHERNCFGKGWVAVAQHAMTMMAQSDLGQQEFRVFFAVGSRIDFDNYILLNQVEIAKELGMHKEHVNRSIKRLVDMGVLLKGPKAGRSITYRLNPNFGWKGKADNHRRAIDDTMKERMKAARIQGVVTSRAAPSEQAEMEQAGQMPLPFDLEQ